MTGLCPAALWKAELENDKCGYLAEISKQHVEGMTCRDLPATYGKM